MDFIIFIVLISLGYIVGIYSFSQIIIDLTVGIPITSFLFDKNIIKDKQTIILQSIVGILFWTIILLSIILVLVFYFNLTQILIGLIISLIVTFPKTYFCYSKDNIMDYLNIYNKLFINKDVLADIMFHYKMCEVSNSKVEFKRIVQMSLNGNIDYEIVDS